MRTNIGHIVNSPKSQFNSCWYPQLLSIGSV